MRDRGVSTALVIIDDECGDERRGAVKVTSDPSIATVVCRRGSGDGYLHYVIVATSVIWIHTSPSFVRRVAGKHT